MTYIDHKNGLKELMPPNATAPESIFRLMANYGFFDTWSEDQPISRRRNRFLE